MPDARRRDVNGLPISETRRICTQTNRSLRRSEDVFRPLKQGPAGMI